MFSQIFRYLRSAGTWILFAVIVGSVSVAAAGEFSFDQKALPCNKPWTSKAFNDHPDNFQFAIVGDRTGGAGTFKIAIGQLNLLQPEFMINVGDLIKGYSVKKSELNVEWDATDGMLNRLQMPFFRTPGNHDIANKVAQQVWHKRYGATYYYFVYDDTLFLVLDSEDPPREAPRGMKEKLALYNRLQTEDPAKAKGRIHVRRVGCCWTCETCEVRCRPNSVCPGHTRQTSRRPLDIRVLA